MINKAYLKRHKGAEKQTTLMKRETRGAVTIFEGENLQKMQYFVHLLTKKQEIHFT